MEEYKIIPQMSFDWMIAAYFFLGGISAGSFIISVIANYWNKAIKPVAKIAALISPVALGAGMLLLIADLGMPFRSYGLFINFNPTSVISYGVWFLNIFLIFALFNAWHNFRGTEDRVKNIAYGGFFFAILMATYTGVLLMQAPARILWHSPIIPVLFLVGGIISGGALVMILVSFTKNNTDALVALGKMVAYFIILELGLLFLEILTLINGGTESIHILKGLMSGPYKFHFWVGEIILGALIPIIVFLKGTTSAQIRILISLFVLLGVYLMRYIVVVGGQVLQVL